MPLTIFYLYFFATVFIPKHVQEFSIEEAEQKIQVVKQQTQWLASKENNKKKESFPVTINGMKVRIGGETDFIEQDLATAFDFKGKLNSTHIDSLLCSTEEQRACIYSINRFHNKVELHLRLYESETIIYTWK
ncbi:MAG: hypothetical protein H7A25_24360 [Leptospiraceae bacterium]|nr:hypothetical protein [Leptospiraceae bacterium]